MGIWSVGMQRAQEPGANQHPIRFTLRRDQWAQLVKRTARHWLRQGAHALWPAEVDRRLAEHAPAVGGDFDAAPSLIPHVEIKRAAVLGQANVHIMGRAG